MDNEVEHYAARLMAFLNSEVEDDRQTALARYNEIIDSGFTPRQAYINLHRDIVEPLLDAADITWEDYTEATATTMYRPTLFDVKTWIELAGKIGVSAATGNWQAVEHEWTWDIPADATY